MKNYSLGTKVSVTFVFCLLLIFVLFVSFYKYENEISIRKFRDDHLSSVNYFLKFYENGSSCQEVEKYFMDFGFKAANNEISKDAVLQYGNMLFYQNGTKERFSTIIYNNTYYLFVECPHGEVLFESEKKLPSNNFFLFVFLSVFGLVIWLYISTIKSIKPINDFRGLVRKFANGDTSIQFDYDGQDEIGELSREFNKAAKTITNLHNSRTLFLRTIMHELKTPIGKGRIVSEMVDDGTQRDRLIKVFKRLEILINEISQIEQLITNNYQIEKKVCKLRDVFEETLSILFLEPEQLKRKVDISLGVKPFCIDVDSELMALVFKNLIDNALKYGSDDFVKVELKRGVISFYNKGKPLDKSIEEFRQAFVTSSRHVKKGGGMGLGLYIVDNILYMHNLKLEYEYKDGYHRFYIKLIKA